MEEDDDALEEEKMQSSKRKETTSDDEDDDSEFEENAGEFALYDSPLEDTDELITIKDTFDEIF